MIKNNGASHHSEEEFDLDAELNKLETLFGKKEAEEELHKIDIEELFNEVMKTDLREAKTNFQEQTSEPVRAIFEINQESECSAPQEVVVAKEIERAPLPLDLAPKTISKVEKIWTPRKLLKGAALFLFVVGSFLLVYFDDKTIQQNIAEQEEPVQDEKALYATPMDFNESQAEAIASNETTGGAATSQNATVEQPASKPVQNIIVEQPAAKPAPKEESQPEVPAEQAVAINQEESSGRAGEQILVGLRNEAPSEERDAKLQAAAELLSKAAKTDRAYSISLLEARRQLTELPRQRMEQYLKERPSLEPIKEAQFLLINLEAYKTRLKQYLADYQEAVQHGVAAQYKKYHQAAALSLQRQIYQLETFQRELVEWSKERERLLSGDYFLLKQQLGKMLEFVPAPYFNR